MGDRGQAHDEGRALSARIVVAKNLAAMLFHDAVADAEPEAGSLAHFLGGEERIEDLVGMRDSVPVIAERDLNNVARTWWS